MTRMTVTRRYGAGACGCSSVRHKPVKLRSSTMSSENRTPIPTLSRRLVDWPIFGEIGREMCGK